MFRSARFWIFMAAFQLLFALGVFALTRAYYVDRAPSARIASAPSGAAAPHPMPATGAQDDLATLISTFPGQAANLTPNLGPGELSRQGDLNFAEQRYDRAAQFYEQALRAGSQDVNDYNSLGLTLHYLGRSAEALAILNEGVALDSGYQRIWLTLGFVNSQAGNTGAAREALSTAVRMDADSDIGRSAAEMLDKLP